MQSLKYKHDRKYNSLIERKNKMWVMDAAQRHQTTEIEE